MIVPFMPDVLAKPDRKPERDRKRKPATALNAACPSLEGKLQQVALTRPATLVIVERLVDVILAGQGKELLGDLYDE